LIVVAADLAAIATMGADSCGDTGDDGGNKQEKPPALAVQVQAEP
jgi:hypothetical protein